MTENDKEMWQGMFIIPVSQDNLYIVYVFVIGRCSIEKGT